MEQNTDRGTAKMLKKNISEMSEKHTHTIVDHQIVISAIDIKPFTSFIIQQQRWMREKKKEIISRLFVAKPHVDDFTCQ